MKIRRNSYKKFKPLLFIAIGIVFVAAFFVIANLPITPDVTSVEATVSLKGK